MGKALKSSMKALQEALVNFIPTGPTCMQQGRTDSFRDFYSSFSSIYYTATASSVSSSSVPAHALYPAPSNGPPPFDAARVPPDDEFCDPVLDDVDIVAARAGSSCCSSGASSSSSLPAAIECENIGDGVVPGPFVPMGPAGAAAGSARFFFSPKTTKSIMEEAKLEAAGLRKMRSLNERAGPGPELHGEPGVEGLEDDGEEEDVVVKEAGGIGHEARQRPHPHPRRHRRRHRRHRSKGGSFCEDSTPLVMSSHDPYMDFRCSMEEMVEAHGVRDWSGLQELLLCYLRLNDKGTHSVIMLAFADLVMHIVSTSESFSSTTTTTNSTAGTTNTSSVMSFCNPTPYSSSSPVLNPCSD